MKKRVDIFVYVKFEILLKGKKHKQKKKVKKNAHTAIL